MTSFARTQPVPAATTTKTRALLLSAACAAIALLAALALAPSASANVTNLSGTLYGVQSRTIAPPLEGTNGFANPEGNPVLSKSNAFVIYWDPQDRYHPEWQQLINGFMHNIGAASGSLGTIFSVDSQYRDKSNEHASYNIVFRGAYTDTHKYPGAGCTSPKSLEHTVVTCLTDQQIREELQSFIAANGLPTGMNSIFYLLTPPDVTVCLDGTGASCSEYARPKRKLFDGFEMEIFARTKFNLESEQEQEAVESESYKNSFCSYHSDINPSGSPTGAASTILYADVPWTAGSAGNGRLLRSERIWSYECQDGGWNPSANPIEREAPAQESKEDETKLAEADAEEKKEKIEQKERETPHVQEPEQVGLGEDGTYDYGLADLIINQISVEQQNLVTDPLLNAWQDPEHHEAAEECRDNFITGGQGSSKVGEGQAGGGSVAAAKTNAGALFNQTIGAANYYLHDAFNLAALEVGNNGVPCVTSVDLEPKFTAPNPVSIGEVVGFDGMESNIMLAADPGYSPSGTPERTYAQFAWTVHLAKSTSAPTVIADGYAPGAPACELPWLSPCAASTYYTFTSPGTYEVTLKVRDTGGNEASVMHEVTVSGAESGASGGGGGGSSPGGSAGGSAASKLPAPVARAAVVSRSLREALSKGLAVVYNVNEKVAGHFEVLLTRKVAHELGIRGPLAADMPAGSEQMVIVARALLVTTKGGQSIVHIKFSKQIAERLRRRKKVALELRLIVHNAATVEPLSTVVATSVTLGAGKHATH